MREYARMQTNFYTEGNTVRKQQVENPNYNDDYELVRVRKVKAKEGLQMNMSPLYFAFLIGAIAVTVAACMFLLDIQAEITTQNTNIASMEAELENLTADNNAKESRINSTINLDEIRRIATDELGMVYPTEGQVVYYETASLDYVKQFQDVPESR